MVNIISVNESKIIVISDTHIGSIYENIYYLSVAYEYALKNNVKTIIHAGDVLQGPIKNVDKKYYLMERQIDHLQNIYPYNPSITNQITLGNHDFQIIKKDKTLLELISRPDLNILGIRKSYFGWQGKIIAVSHECPKYKASIPNLSSFLHFCGHAHKFCIRKKDNHIFVPTLSDDLKDDSLPGFLVATLTEEEIYIELISIGKTVSSPQLVLRKSLNDS